LAKWTFAVGFCLMLVATGTLVGKYWKNPILKSTISKMKTIDVLEGDPLASYTPANYLPDHPHTLNLLILGCDRDYVGKRINGVAVPVPLMNTNGRSDAIMIAHYDFDKKTISLMTIPRDTAVHVPGHSTHKINAAHQFGGPELTQQTIKDAFGIDTDAYVSLHFEAFEKIVDTVGGVDINVKKPLDYDDNWALLHIHLKPGQQHLNGYQAMGYVRIRHSDSDLMRAERQHEFLEALRNQIRTPKMLWEGVEVLNTITDNLHMSPNLNTDKLLALANWSKALPKESITLATMPCIEGPSYVTVNRKPARKMVAQSFFGGTEDSVTMSRRLITAAMFRWTHRCRLPTIRTRRRTPARGTPRIIREALPNRTDLLPTRSPTIPETKGRTILLPRTPPRLRLRSHFCPLRRPPNQRSDKTEQGRRGVFHDALYFIGSTERTQLSELRGSPPDVWPWRFCAGARQLRGVFCRWASHNAHERGPL
jgi:LCP family protein required for cell wall assembly